MVYVDRGGTRGFSNPYFTDTFATYYSTSNNAIKLRALFDVSTLELFVDDGSRVATSLFFFKDPPDSLVFSAQGGAIQMNDLRVHAFRSIWERPAGSARQADAPI